MAFGTGRSGDAAKRFLFVWAAVCFLTGAMLRGEQDSLEKALPPGAPGEWKMEGAPDEVIGDDLYLYINGGAEIYHEYGFQRVIVQEYAGPENRSISLEIYRMTDPAAAFGMYSFKTSDGGEAAALGDGGRVEDYYLNFWKGNHLVTLTGFDESPATLTGLKSLAEEVARRLPPGANGPRLAGMLPGTGLVRAGLKYFKGPLGLFNIHRFFERTVIEFDAGVFGPYRDGRRMFIFEYSGDKSGPAFSAWKSGFRDDSSYRDFQMRDERTFSVRSASGDLIAARKGNRFVAIALGVPTCAEAAAWLESLDETFEN